jgi:hypothetical protein
MHTFVPGIGDAHMTVDVVQRFLVPEDQQQIVGVRKHVQRHYDGEEHGHPGALQTTSWSVRHCTCCKGEDTLPALKVEAVKKVKAFGSEGLR